MADLNIGVGTRPTELNLNLDVGTVMGVYTAGEGIWIEDHVINADVTQSELDSVAASIPTYGPATTDAAGLMSAADKSKLDGIAEGADKSDAYTKAEVDERLNELDNLLTNILQRLGSVEGVTTQATEQAIGEYVEAHGVKLVTTVTDGNLIISMA